MLLERRVHASSPGELWADVHEGMMDDGRTAIDFVCDKTRKTSVHVLGRPSNVTRRIDGAYLVQINLSPGSNVA